MKVLKVKALKSNHQTVVSVRYNLEKEFANLSTEYKATGDALRQLATDKNMPYFDYNTATRKVNVVIPENHAIQFSPLLIRMLGFDDDNALQNKVSDTKIVQASLIINLMSDVNSLCIYTNVMEHQYIGDVRVPLLRTVHIDDKDGICVTKTYPQSFYKNVSLRYIDIIEIDIRDMYGRKIHFSDGDVVVNKLNFRRRRPALI